MICYSMFLVGIQLHSPEPNITDATIEFITAHFIVGIKVYKKNIMYLWLWYSYSTGSSASLEDCSNKSQVSIIITQPAVWCEVPCCRFLIFWWLKDSSSVYIWEGLSQQVATIITDKLLEIIKCYLLCFGMHFQIHSVPIIDKP